MALEYAWSQLVMPLPWTTALLPEGIPSAAIAGVAGGVLGGLSAPVFAPSCRPRRIARAAFLGSFAALLAVGVNAGIREVPEATAKVEMTEVRPEPNREALATVTLDPPGVANDPNWLYVLAWQGGGSTQRVVVRLEPDRAPASTARPSRSRSREAGSPGLRLHSGRDRGAVPLRLPADEGLEGSAQQAPHR